MAGLLLVKEPGEGVQPPAAAAAMGRGCNTPTHNAAACPLYRERYRERLQGLQGVLPELAWQHSAVAVGEGLSITLPLPPLAPPGAATAPSRE